MLKLKSSGKGGVCGALTLKKLYRSLRSAFTVKAGEIEREGKSQWKWLPGLQRIGDIEIILDKSQKYGNRFSTKFAN